MKKLKAALSARDFERRGVHRGGWWAPFFCADNEPDADREIKAAGSLLAEAFILLDASGEYRGNEAIAEWRFGIGL